MVQRGQSRLYSLCVWGNSLWVRATQCVCVAARRAPHSLLKGRLWQSQQVQWLQGDSEALLYGLITLNGVLYISTETRRAGLLCVRFLFMLSSFI